MENKEDMKLWSFIIFTETFSWTVDMNMQIRGLMMSLFPTYFVFKIWKYSFFFCSNIILHLFSVDIRQVLLFYSWNMGFSSFLWTNLMENCEAMTSSTYLFACSYRLFRKSFIKIANIQNFITFLFLIIRFTSNFHLSVSKCLLFLVN